MTPEEHAAKFAQVTKNLKILADQLIAQHPDFGQIYIALAYLAVAIMLGLPPGEYREIGGRARSGHRR